MKSISSKAYKIVCGAPNGPTNYLLKSTTILINTSKITSIDQTTNRLYIRFDGDSSNNHILVYKTEEAAIKEFKALELHIDQTINPREPELK